MMRSTTPNRSLALCCLLLLIALVSSLPTPSNLPAVPVSRSTAPSSFLSSAPLNGGAQDDLAESSVTASVFNLVNNVAGAGLLTLSAGMAKGTGWIPALSICTFLGLCSAHSFTLIGRACELTGEKDFKGLWARTLGERSSSFVDVMVALMCSAAGVIYSGVLGDVSTELLASAGFPAKLNGRTSNILIITAFILLPLSLLKNLSALAFTSFFGFTSIVYTVLFIAFRWLDGSYALGTGKFVVDELITKPTFNKNSLLNIDFTSLVLASNLGLSYIAHYNAPAYFRELKEKTKFKQMVFTSFGILTALYALVMGAGYATFGDTCQGNILLNYHPSDALSTLARFATLVSILVGFPLVFCGIREGVLSILLNSGYKANFELTVLALLSIVTFFSITVADISVVAGLTGAAMGSMIVYILPALIYTKSVKGAFGINSAEYSRSKNHLALLPVGAFLAVFGVMMTLKGE